MAKILFSFGPRYGHACGVMGAGPSRMVIMVAGGFNAGPLSSVEYLNVDGNSEWEWLTGR